MSLARLQNKIVLLPHSRAYTRTHTPALYVLPGLSEGQFETSVGSIDLEGEKNSIKLFNKSEIHEFIKNPQ